MHARRCADASGGLVIAFAVITAGLGLAAVKTYAPLFATPAGECAGDAGSGRPIGEHEHRGP
ncbi:MAG: hypothetical protein HUU14_06960 [Dehalococcoidia bacterium]|nr:hypothetical protein [Chloroflexi bacterium CFX7]NUQ55605.1 hypothetical protein [Dehalococcoidia bacterium]RIL04363.1 MAG: hypothetical protein DCC78_01950 [bacterium]